MVTPEFAKDLSDSIRPREEGLAEFITDITASEKTEDQNFEVEKKSHGEPTSIRVRSHPAFVEGNAEQFFKIFKEYFEEKVQQPLFSRLTKNVSPKGKLRFNSNANQLADAFQQLIEANSIVSCNKAELEGWSIEHLQYVSNSHAKSFTAGYSNRIVSSDVKICKSAILTIFTSDFTDMRLSPLFINRRGVR